MISHTEAQELHRLIGGPIEAATEYAVATMVSVKDLERARELAALIVADTEALQPIHVYFTGDEEGPDRFGLVYDTQDEAMECAYENQLHVWRVPVLPEWEASEEVHTPLGAEGGDDDE